MADLLQQANNWLEDQRQKHRTISVRYLRQGASVSLPATVGRTIFRTDDGYGRIQRVESRDYLIAAADLVLDGTVVTPERGDEIVESADGQDLIYEVMAPAGEPEWRWSDPYRSCLRIHTKHTGTEATP